MNDQFLDFIKKRGFISQCTDEENLKKTLSTKTLGYIGFDCTSDSLHVGSLLPLMILKHFQNFGHTPIVLLGGGTTLIGDPSGKDETRKILSSEEINSNKKKLKKVFERFLSFDSSKENPALLVDNYEWLSNLNLINFLRDVGSKFSVNKMLSLESIKQRLNREQNLSFLEFNYSILQAFDFFELFKKYNCKVQFGGSDQWGNIISGIDLIKRIKNTEQVFGLTSPLITTSNGKKMGKTADGAIWLSKDKYSVQNFWQYWRNTADEDVIRFLYLFTEININEIKNYEKFDGSDLNKVKIILANEVTKNCHGENEAKNAEREANKILVKKSLDLETISKCENKIILNENQTINISVKQALVELKLCNSNSEAKKLIIQGAVKLNDKTVTDKDFLVNNDCFINNEIKYVVIYVGKKKYGVIQLIS
ncbi:MAG: tyrosine--tRNA ligase [Pelagibacteraceae bacterium TMED124]|nr:tyrosine--tRNA ligase [Rickettsiales bacterium]RPG16674.1 MAG: tyrosine--tRNA ligase [Pelagibacteraceae bacterium TMED124]|tara:strand:- start:6740 stop:8008 length:1269 start_codon:yes stop_codon:yes gene_type:complete